MAPAQSLHDARLYTVRQISAQVNPLIAKEIEQSILDYTKRACKERNMDKIRWSDITVRRLYLRKMRMILNNLNELMKLVEKQDITWSECAFVDHKRMRPDIYQPILDNIEQREKLTLLVDSEENEDHQSVLKCEGCGSFRTTYVTMQTRSADEPETIYMKCFNCGKNDTIRG
jgi:DNA-directed RNA polymerase subunit M/transcription elongation factor TFIIS